MCLLCLVFTVQLCFIDASQKSSVWWVVYKFARATTSTTAVDWHTKCRSKALWNCCLQTWTASIRMYKSYRIYFTQSPNVKCRLVYNMLGACIDDIIDILSMWSHSIFGGVGYSAIHVASNAYVGYPNVSHSFPRQEKLKETHWKVRMTATEKTRVPTVLFRVQNTTFTSNIKSQWTQMSQGFGKCFCMACCSIYRSAWDQICLLMWNNGQTKAS